MQKSVYHVREFCERYSISRSTLYREIGRGHICIVKCGWRTFISRKDAQRWLQERTKLELCKRTPCCGKPSRYKLYWKKLLRLLTGYGSRP